MSDMASLYPVLALVLVSSILGYGAMIMVIRLNPNKSSEAALVRSAMQNLGIDRPAWHTLAVTASRDLNLTLDQVWETWSDLNSWSQWSPMHQSARWLEGETWQPGARFEQTQSLGIPFGRHKSVETIAEAIPQRKVRWCKKTAGQRSCQIWSFQLLPNRKVRVTNTLVTDGAVIGLLKPVLFFQWQRRFEKSLDNLARASRGL